MSWLAVHELHSLYRAADLLLVLTNSEADTMQGLGVKENRIRVIGNGPILAPDADGKGFLDRHAITGPVVLFLGQHFSYKGYRQLLEAMPLVWRRVPDTHFMFVGPSVGRSESFFVIISDRRVRRLGRVGLQDKTDALAAASVLCVPSSQESFGGVYVEAWALGKPVVGCAIPAVAEVIDDGVNGCLVAQKASAIADSLVWLLEHPEDAAKLGEAGRRKVEECYSWRRIGALTKAAYASVVQG